MEEETKEAAPEATTFEELGVSAPLRAAIEALGWERPTPIQVKGIPAGLEGNDLVGIAQTGTGKTCAIDAIVEPGIHHVVDAIDFGPASFRIKIERRIAPFVKFPVKHSNYFRRFVVYHGLLLAIP